MPVSTVRRLIADEDDVQTKEAALTELARFLPRSEQQRNRYLRSGMRPREQEAGPPGAVQSAHQAPALYHARTGSFRINPGIELPPGASFDPDPQTSINSQQDNKPLQ